MGRNAAGSGQELVLEGVSRRRRFGRFNGEHWRANAPRSSELSYEHKPLPPPPPVTLEEMLELVKEVAAEDVRGLPAAAVTEISVIVDGMRRLVTIDRMNSFTAMSAARRMKRSYEGARSELFSIREKRRDGQLAASPPADAVDFETAAVEWVNSGGWR